MKARGGIALLWIALAFGLAIDARGDVLTFEFSGLISEEPTDPDDDFPEIGLHDRFTGSFRYDTDIPAVIGGTAQNAGRYVPVAPFSTIALTVEGTTFANNPDMPSLITVFDDDVVDNVPVDIFVLLNDKEKQNPPLAPEGFSGTPIQLGLSLLSINTQVLPDIALPTRLEIDDWNDTAVWFEGLSSVSHSKVDIRGRMDSLHVIPVLQAGDANQDLQFNQLDLILAQIGSKYRTGQPATWGEGDWNGAPGGAPGAPPPGDGLFNQLDVVAALNAGVYLTGPYAGLVRNGLPADGQVSIGYDARSGEIWVDTPLGTELTSMNIDSASGIFTADAATNLGGSFDNDADDNLFKATFGSSFGSLTFGNVAQAGLAEQFVLDDLAVVGSLAGGGGLGDVDLIYVPAPEPGGLLLAGSAMLLLLVRRRIGPRVA